MCELLGSKGTHFRDGSIETARLREAAPRIGEQGNFIAQNLIDYAEETKSKVVTWEHFNEILRFFSTAHIIDLMNRCYKAFVLNQTQTEKIEKDQQ